MGARGRVGVRLTLWTTERLSEMVKRGLRDGRVMIDSRRRRVLSSVMVVSTAGTMKILRIFILKIAQHLDGSDGFCSV
jgi:membrane protein required for beta-lactamase induction